LAYDHLGGDEAQRVDVRPRTGRAVASRELLGAPYWGVKEVTVRPVFASAALVFAWS
jgi:hypothetical protein